MNKTYKFFHNLCQFCRWVWGRQKKCGPLPRVDSYTHHPDPGFIPPQPWFLNTPLVTVATNICYIVSDVFCDKLISLEIDMIWNGAKSIKQYCYLLFWYQPHHYVFMIMKGEPFPYCILCFRQLEGVGEEYCLLSIFINAVYFL